jgi:hypothetical protein
VVASMQRREQTADTTVNSAELSSNLHVRMDVLSSTTRLRIPCVAARVLGVFLLVVLLMTCSVHVCCSSRLIVLAGLPARPRLELTARSIRHNESV